MRKRTARKSSHISKQGSHIGEQGRHNTKTTMLFILLAISFSTIMILAYANDLNNQIQPDQNTPACTTTCNQDNDCNDKNPNTTDTCENPGSCEAECMHTPVSHELEPQEPEPEEPKSVFEPINENHYKYTKDNIKITIGGKEESFKPEIELTKWDNEVSLTVSLATEKNIKPTLNGNKIGWKDTSIEANFYPIKDGFEFEIVLKEKPLTNKIILNIKSKNLTFAYQGELSGVKKMQGYDCNATHCYDINKNLVGHRPTKIVGSYAVYYSTKSGNEYETGKTFHIYRPYAFDGSGNGTWCSMWIENGEMTITIPQKFLDNATYPITIDPAFGKMDIGGTGYNGTNMLVGSRYTYTSPETGTADSIIFYTKSKITPLKIKCGMYSSDRTTFLGSTEERTIGTTAAWETFVFASGPSLSASTDYFLVCWTEDGYEYEDSNTGILMTWGTHTYNGWPDDISGDTSWSNLATSIYATYSLPPSDSCSCPENGHWNITSGDICTMSSDCSLSGGDLHIVDGSLTVVDGTTLVVPTGYKIIIEKATGAKLVVEKGGKLVIEK